MDEKRLFKALESYYDCLTEAESMLVSLNVIFSKFMIYIFDILFFFFIEKRNVRGDDRLYVGLGNSNYNFIKELYISHVRFDIETSISIDGMRGTVLLAEDCVGDGATLPSPINSLPVRNNKVYWYV